MNPVHPELEELLEYADGAQSGSPLRRLERHLKRCAECRQEVVRLRLAAIPAAPPCAPPDGLLTRIREWEEQRRREDPRGTSAGARIAAEIAPFLGKRAAERIVEAAAREGQGVLSAVEPVLEVFLGSRTARLLVSAVVDRALLRT